MADMSISYTYALDQQTVENIECLAHSWGVSQAEVIRRSVQLAAKRKATPTLSPVDVVAYYTEHSVPRGRAETQRLIKSMRGLRHEGNVRLGDNPK